jgi:hypothetical protein
MEMDMASFIAQVAIGILTVLIALAAIYRKPFVWFSDWRRARRTPPPIHPIPEREVWTPRPEVSQMNRAVGYCENTDCEDFAKGVFLLNHGDNFYCPRCRAHGHTEKEVGTYDGDGEIFKEVRCEYNFDPINRAYREIAIVRDESLWGRCRVYTLKSPLIKTENRALKVSEAVLANLNRYRGLLEGDGIPRTTETVLSFDEPAATFSSKLQSLSKEWEASELANKGYRVQEEEDPALGDI